jgi:hypothetical protein
MQLMAAAIVRTQATSTSPPVTTAYRSLFPYIWKGDIIGLRHALTTHSHSGQQVNELRSFVSRDDDYVLPIDDEHDTPRPLQSKLGRGAITWTLQYHPASESPLCAAIECGGEHTLEMVKLLVEHGADVNYCSPFAVDIVSVTPSSTTFIPPHRGRRAGTILMHAIRWTTNVELVQYLVEEAKADVNGTCFKLVIPTDKWVLHPSDDRWIEKGSALWRVCYHHSGTEYGFAILKCLLRAGAYVDNDRTRVYEPPIWRTPPLASATTTTTSTTRYQSLISVASNALQGAHILINPM